MVLSRRVLLIFTTSVFFFAIANVNGQNTFDKCERDEQCINGGSCEYLDGDGQNFRHCHCPKGFGGDRCEKNCPLNCANGGVCLSEKKTALAYLNGGSHENDVRCKCHGYFRGELCETPFINCGGGRRCFYGGTCPDVNSTQHRSAINFCTCPPDRRGDYCEFEAIDEIAFPVTPQETSGFCNERWWCSPGMTMWISVGAAAGAVIIFGGLLVRWRYRSYSVATKEDKIRSRIKSRLPDEWRSNLATVRENDRREVPNRFKTSKYGKQWSHNLV